MRRGVAVLGPKRMDRGTSYASSWGPCSIQSVWHSLINRLLSPLPRLALLLQPRSSSASSPRSGCWPWPVTKSCFSSDSQPASYALPPKPLLKSMQHEWRNSCGPLWLCRMKVPSTSIAFLRSLRHSPHQWSSTRPPSSSPPLWAVFHASASTQRYCPYHSHKSD